MGLTRDEQEVDVIYVCPDETAFVTPDGVGRFWYSDEAEAEEEHGPLPVVYLDDYPEDF